MKIKLKNDLNKIKLANLREQTKKCSTNDVSVEKRMLYLYQAFSVCELMNFWQIFNKCLKFRYVDFLPLIADFAHPSCFGLDSPPVEPSTPAPGSSIGLDSSAHGAPLTMSAPNPPAPTMPTWSPPSCAWDYWACYCFSPQLASSVPATFTTTQLTYLFYFSNNSPPADNYH